MLTVYQIDDRALLLGDPPYARQAPAKGHLQVLAAPPAVPAGHVARWVTAQHPVIDTKTYGNPGTGTWELVEDHRKDKLYVTSDGSPYTIDAEVDGQTYTGVDVLPAWLSTIERPGKNYNWTAGAWVLDVAAQLADDQAAQTALMEQAYSNAVAQDVTFKTAAGVTKTYQADADSQDILNKTLNVCKTAGAVPDGFWWKSKDNTLVPFTLADLGGLASAMLDQGWAAFQILAARKAAITGATTSAAVKAINW
ncbi:DUF4376 domain-containing protein [Castellaniella sp. UC4442_H9]